MRADEYSRDARRTPMDTHILASEGEVGDDAEIGAAVTWKPPEADAGDLNVAAWCQP